MQIKRPRGTKDILPDQVGRWQYIEGVIRKLCEDFGFLEIRTPVFEHTQLFSRGVGDTTDVVQKEMYTFTDKDDRSLTLRPEGTASCVRAFLENGLFGGNLPEKYYYLISCFRYEKPQAGRFREFHQFGVEMFGTGSPLADAEVISLADGLFKRLGISGLSLNINSLGCQKCKGEYNSALSEYFGSHSGELCETCRERLKKNPMRIIDCKNPICAGVVKGAPSILEYICGDCRFNFEKTGEYLNEAGISFTVDSSIVRGLDYYTGVVFEFVSDKIGGKATVCGGGRYDGLIEELGGKSMPGLGFAVGLERLILAMEAENATLNEEAGTVLYIAPMGDAAAAKAFSIASRLREANVCVQMDLMGRSLKSQMKYADKLGARFVGILGTDELEKGELTMKNMKTGEQSRVPFDDIIEHLK